MVSGFLISPKDHDLILSGLETEIPIVLKSSTSELGLFVVSNVFFNKVIKYYASAFFNCTSRANDFSSFTKTLNDSGIPV